MSDGYVAIMAMVSGIAAKITAGLAGIGAWIGSWMPGGRSERLLPGFQPPNLGGDGAPQLHRQNWAPPPSRPGVMPIRHVLMIDGHKIGEAVSHYIAVGATHVQAAAQYDGGLAHVPVDIQMA